MRMLTALAFIVCLSFVAAAQNPPELFKKTCQNCHGADGKGNTVPGKKMNIPDLASPAVQGLSDEAMFETIAYGQQHKQYPHAYAERGIPPASIRDVVKFIRTLKK